MICLLLIMTMIFINSTESAEQKVRHLDTLLKEEEMNAKTKAWLLMVESGKVDQEELRRITPKSIFIAPNRQTCGEGEGFNHLGKCVKIIKPLTEAEKRAILLKVLHKQFLEKQKKEKNKENEEKEEETGEHLEVSNGPLHFSLPISNSDKKDDEKTTEVKSETQQDSSTTVKATTEEVQSAPEFIPIPLPLNETTPTNQTKEIESSGAEPLNETEIYETSMFEGSGDAQSASGDGLQEEESTTPSQVSILSEETDYFDVTETDSTTFMEIYSTTETPVEELDSTIPPVKEALLQESYQNNTNVPNVNNSAAFSSKEIVRKEIVENNSNSERIYFPSDDAALRTQTKLPIQSSSSSSIRFPDEIPQQQIPSYHWSIESNTKSNRYQIHSSAIPQEEFWWLPKNWQIDETQKKSPLLKVWSRLPLIHDITYTHETPEGFKLLPPIKEPQQQIVYPQHRNEGFTKSPIQQQSTGRVIKPFKNSRFHDILITPRQNFRFQR